MKTLKRSGCGKCGRPGHKYVYCPSCWKHVMRHVTAAGLTEAEWIQRMDAELSLKRKPKRGI